MARGQKLQRKLARREAQMAAQRARREMKVAQKLHARQIRQPLSLKPWLGDPPYPAPAGTMWVNRGGRPKLIIAGATKLAKKIVRKQLRAAGIIGRGDGVAYPDVPAAQESYAYGPDSPMVQPGTALPMPDLLEPAGLPFAYDAPGYYGTFPQYGTLPAPATDVDPRMVYGSPRVSYLDAAEYGDYGYGGGEEDPYGYYGEGEGAGEPYSEYGYIDETQTYPDIDDSDAEWESDSYTYDQIEDADVYSLPYDSGLSGLTDWWQGIKGWSLNKWNEVVAYFKAQLGAFLQADAQLKAASRRIATLQKVTDRAPSVPDTTRNKLFQLAQVNRSLADEYPNVEAKVKGALEKIQSVQAQLSSGQTESGTVGILPVIALAIGAGAIAVVGAAGAAMIIYVSRVKEHLKELDMIEKGILTPAQAAALREAGGGGLLPDFGKAASGLAALGAVALIGYFFYTRKRR